MPSFYDVPAHPLAAHCAHSEEKGPDGICSPCRSLSDASARHALDGLSEWHIEEAKEEPLHSEEWAQHTAAEKDAYNYREANYPEPMGLFPGHAALAF